jgi:SNF2 family DNA or RNA helicase
MGLGKTLVVETLVEERQSHENTLVLAPYRVARNVWRDEAAEWDHLQDLTVAPIVGTAGERRAALRTRAHIHTINYENIGWLLNEIPASRWPFKTVISDESSRLKSYRTSQGGKRAAALASIAARARYWVNLTGTPGVNGLHDLWGPQWFVDYGDALGPSYASFLRRWFYKEVHAGEHARVLAFAHSRKEIEERMRSTTMSIRAKDWFDVAEPIRTTVHVELPAAARREYKRMARDLYALIESKQITAVNAGVKSGKLLQMASGAVYDKDGGWVHVHDEKMKALESVVAEANGAPLLVAYEYRHTLERIRKAFPQARVLKTKRDEDDWNAGKIEILVAHPMSAGHGLNLQHGGNMLCYVDHTWHLEAYLQILERLGPVRQMQSGYDRPVFVYSIVADKTMDNAVLAVNGGKVSVMEALMASLRATM